MKFALPLCCLGVFSLLSSGCSDYEDPGGTLLEPTPIQHTARPQELRQYEEGTRSFATPVGSEDLVILPGDPAGLLAASDATTDAVYIVDIIGEQLLHKVAFTPGTHPGRIATGKKDLFVVLRRTGEVARITRDGQIARRTNVCPAPRGVVVDEQRERIWVACASGELVWLSRDDLQVGETFYIAPDLRDVALVSGHVFVSSFRAAEVLRVDPEDGAILGRRHAPSPNMFQENSDNVNSLWRMIPTQDGQGLFLSYHQVASMALIISTGGYYSGIACARRPVGPVVARVPLAEDGSWGEVDVQCSGSGALPVDIDEDRCGSGYALFAAPDIVDKDPLFRNNTPSSSCAPETHVDRFDLRLAATIDALGHPLILSRGEGLHINFTHPADGAKKLTLDENSPSHLGQLLFHGDLGSGMACATCHPEGGDDGQLWIFERVDFDKETNERQTILFQRRTQNLRAGVQGRLHWDGEFEDMGSLMGEVFSKRMTGFELIDGDGEAIADWLEQLEPEPGLTPRPEDRDLVSRGALLYVEAGCDSCHIGEMLTDFEFHDVGTGGLRKTPTLRGVGQRRRLMSDGCAVGLEQRFTCGGKSHGDLRGFEDGDLEALIAYLETL